MDDYARPSYWQSPAVPQALVPTVAAPPRAHGVYDVCIVGAGIAGLSTAYQLMRRGRRVLVLDDGDIGGGQTGRTSAHLSCVLDDGFRRLEALRGDNATRMAAGSHAAAIDAIERTVIDLGIDCDFRRIDGYLYAHDADQAAALDEEEAAAHLAGLHPQRLERVPLPDAVAGPCLRYPYQARFEPLVYLAGLQRALTEGGAVLLMHTRVKEVFDAPAPGVATTDGVRYDADAVVIATNAPIDSPLAMPLREFAQITYVVALEAPPGVADGLYWDLDEPYHYLRLARQRDGSQVILVGGEDHATGRDEGTPPEERFRRLERWARQRLLGVGAVVAQWSGQVLETPDGLAFIGRSPGASRVFVASGDSGMGMTHGTIAALMLPDLIEGRSHPWERLYRPSRLPLRTLADCAREVLAMNLAYGYWLRRDGPRSADQLKPGSGAVMRRGLRPRAVYKDAGGSLHEASPICPHLGGKLRWNTAEQTWDCPVHGSRFDCRGELLQGPANQPLYARAPG